MVWCCRNPIEIGNRPLHTKLHINISQGIIDIEGDADLVREVYSDFKDQLLNGVKPQIQEHHPVDIEDSSSNAVKPKRRSGQKKKTIVSSDKVIGGVVANAPKLDKNLNTLELKTFYGQFEAKNNPEKILIFLKFITENLGISAPNTDQVYTCYKAVGEKIPSAFAQAFNDTSTKNGYIDYRSPTDIKITIAGENHFTHTLKRKLTE